MSDHYDEMEYPDGAGIFQNCNHHKKFKIGKHKKLKKNKSRYMNKKSQWCFQP